MIAARLLLAARSGELDHIDLIFDRTVGKPHQEVKIDQQAPVTAAERAQATVERLRAALTGSGN